MRATQLISVFLLAGLLFSACERVQTPEQVAEKFLEYMEYGKYEEAKKFGTESTHEILESLQAFGEFDEPEPRKISDIKCEIEGDVAKCTYMADDERGEIYLIKEEEKWLVDMTKESPF